MRYRIRKNSKNSQLLKYLAIGSGMVILSMVSPLGSAQLIRNIIKGYFRKKRFEKERFLRDIKRLQIRELIDYQELGDGKIKIVITKAGKNLALLNDLDNISLKPQKKWDRKWRLILFDIPHLERQARDAFREKLKDLNFYPLQKSVFITPFPCEEEIDFIASIFDIRRYILILYISHFEGEEKLKYHFKV